MRLEDMISYWQTYRGRQTGQKGNGPRGDGWAGAGTAVTGYATLIVVFQAPFCAAHCMSEGSGSEETSRGR